MDETGLRLGDGARIRAAYPQARVNEDTVELWLTELEQFDSALGEQGVRSLIASVRRYIRATRRRVSFEYALIAGVNDSDEQARELAGRLKGLLCHVNLIPLNPTPAFPYERPSVERIDRCLLYRCRSDHARPSSATRDV